MIHYRVSLLALPLLACFAWLPAVGQSIVSTHSGVVYFFEGSVSVDDQQLEQKFGKFPDIGDGHQLRTAHGRAEVLLTPGVMLRADENTTIRMLSTALSDTRVELIAGSAIVESSGQTDGTAVTLLYKSWKVKVPQTGVYRIDSEPAQVRVYKGNAEVSADGRTDSVTVSEGQNLALAAVLVPEATTLSGSDAFRNWAMGRSQMIASDNATAAGIVDDPSLIDNPDAGLSGLSYFPITGIPSLGLTTPYGVSFWSPFQPGLSAGYYPSVMIYPYVPIYGSGWPTGIRFQPYQPHRIIAPGSLGGVVRPGGIVTRPTYVPPRVPGRVATPGGVHAAGHR